MYRLGTYLSNYTSVLVPPTRWSHNVSPRASELAPTASRYCRNRLNVPAFVDTSTKRPTWLATKRASWWWRWWVCRRRASFALYPARDVLRRAFAVIRSARRRLSGRLQALWDRAAGFEWSRAAAIDPSRPPDRYYAARRLRAGRLEASAALTRRGRVTGDASRSNTGRDVQRITD